MAADILALVGLFPFLLIEVATVWAYQSGGGGGLEQGSKRQWGGR